MTAHERNTLNVFAFIFGFLAGVLLSSFVSITPLVSIWIILVALACAAAEGQFTLIALVLLSFGLGILRYDIKDFHEDILPTNHGVVVSEPEYKENTTRFVMFADNGEKLLVSTGLYSPVEYGDEVNVEGKVEKPSMIEDFDYAKYLSKDDVYYTMSFAEAEVVSSGNGNKLKTALFKIKNAFIAKIREILPEPESSLLAGLLVAGKGAMPRNILDEFQRAGIIHIVVLSGYNITIIADFIRRMFVEIFLKVKVGGPRSAAVAAVLGVTAFVLMTGAEATVVRAAIMAMVVVGAKVFDRTYDATRALIAAALIMVIHNPKILVFDPSFQLSFLAMCGLIYLAPIVKNFAKFEVLSTTIATQLMVLPFLIYSMGEVSLVSLPANLLVLLVIPYAMLLGFLATLFAFLIPASLLLILSFPAHLLLGWILGVSHFLGNLPFASISLPTVPLWMICLVYISLIMSLLVFFKKYKV